MPKKLKSARGLKAEIDLRIREGNDLDGDCQKCEASLPREVPRESRGYYGANWMSEYVLHSEGPACDEVVHKYVRQVMDEYDCSDWP